MRFNDSAGTENLSPGSEDSVTPVTDRRGNVHLFVKLASHHIVSLQAPVPILQIMIVCPMPSAAVVCWMIEILDNPRAALRVRVYFDILDVHDRTCLRRLGRQKIVPVHFRLGQSNAFTLTKPIPAPSNTKVAIKSALSYSRGIPRERRDFSSALAGFRRSYADRDITDWSFS